MNATVKYIVDVGRVAGYSSNPAPPKEIVGKRVKIWRELISWHGYWVEYKGEKYVLAHAELYDGTTKKCDCRDCREIHELKAGAQ